MKILSIITTGGKCLIASGVFLLFSCDSTQSLTVNGKQTLSYSLHDNEIKIAAGKFGHDYHIFISSDKAITVQPDSFQYEFSRDVSTEKIDYYGYERKSKDDVKHHNSIVLRKCWAKSLSMDSVMLKVIPNDCILYQGNRVITDTIYINLNTKKTKYLQ